MLSIKNLHVAYGQSEVVHDISFEAPSRQVTAIMGKNGMGKSTLMKSIIGVVQPKSGSVTVDGTEVTNWDSCKRVRAGIAYVPQGRQIFSKLTVEENILSGLNPRSTQKRTLMNDAYSMFNVLYDMRNRKGGNLSGGQQQQLAIARALVSEPKVLILDEPTEGIQPSIIKDIARLLNQIKIAKDLSIIVTEQVLSFTIDIADHMYVIESGRFIHSDAKGAINAEKIKGYLSV